MNAARATDKPPTVVLVLTVGHLMLAVAAAAKHESIHLKMPNIMVPKQEQYLCIAHRVSGPSNNYIVSFEPRASASSAHHLIVYACSASGSPKQYYDPGYVWDCGYGQLPVMVDNPYEGFSVCAPGELSTLIYVLVLPDAPSLVLPQDVGIKVGGDSSLNYLVMQLHYKPQDHSGPSHGLTDSSGVIVHTTSGHNHGITKLADVYALSSRRSVPVGLSRQSLQCGIREDMIIHPFMYMAHTHDLGVKVGLYKFPGGNRARPVLIGEADPQEPQVYLPVRDDSVTLERGDIMMSYCDYNNTGSRTVYYGLSHEDEMCILFLMYWVEGDELLRKRRSCGFF